MQVPEGKWNIGAMANNERDAGKLEVVNLTEEGHDPLQDELKLTSEAQAVIGRQLRELYSEMLNAPVPDKFTKLLADLTKAESKS